MAAASARAAWQRMANRCFVQEDAKRAPKLACCPSSSFISQYDSGSGDASADGTFPVPIVSNYFNINCSSGTSIVPPETKWHVQMQTGLGNQKYFTGEQPDNLVKELQGNNKKIVDHSSRLPDDMPDANGDMSIDSITKTSLELPRIISSTSIQEVSEARGEDLKFTKTNNKLPVMPKVESGDLWHKGEKMMDWKVVDQSILKKSCTDCPAQEPYWLGGEKTGPWWRISNREELALFVAKKSVEHLENCDLPTPQKMQVSNDAFGYLENFDVCGLFSAVHDHNSIAGICSQADCVQNNSNPRGVDGKHSSSTGAVFPLFDSEQRSRGFPGHDNRKQNEGYSDPDFDRTRSEISEALCHSQTRAREAEFAAQKAHNEKEHMIRLFFQQASQLFAYKQLLQLVQLESTLLYKKMKEHNEEKAEGSEQERCDICRYLFAFVVGLSLAGAGLLLGWTLGWLLSVQ